MMGRRLRDEQKPTLRAKQKPIYLFLPENIYDLAIGWYLHVKREQLKHILSADINEKWHFRIGYPAVVLQAVIGVSVFATYTQSENISLKAVAIILTLISAGLVALQNFGGFAREAEKHRLAGSRLKSIIQEFEYQLLNLNKAKSQLDQSTEKDNDLNGKINTFGETLKKLREDYQRIENESPQAFWPGVSEEVDNLPPKDITDFLCKAHKTNGSDRSSGDKDTVDDQPKRDQ
jgi:hypothetical protein